MTDTAPTLGSLGQELRSGRNITRSLDLCVGDWRLRVATNSVELVERLRRYFRYFPGDGETPDEIVYAIETDEQVDFGLSFRDWPREGGKAGRKDEFADVPGGRVVRKVRTGMQYLVGREERVVIGRCIRNDNQVVNFINALYMNRMLSAGYILCHAAGVTLDGKGLAIAAVSGGGKSTLALHMLGRGLSYVSNDRLLIRSAGARASMSGVPKLPRINPGTALNNPNLSGVVPQQRRTALAALDPDELWRLEEKHDVFIDEHFPQSRFELCSPLTALMVLTWDRSSREPTSCERVDLDKRPDVLAPVMKSAGPFYVPAAGEPLREPAIEPQRYLTELARVPVYAVSGRVDFDLGCRLAAGALSASEPHPDAADRG